MTMTIDRLQALQFTPGDRMKKSMKVARLSRYDMAEYLGVDPATISNWVNDRIKPTKQSLMLWALKTEVTVEWLETGVVRPEGFEPPTY